MCGKDIPPFWRKDFYPRTSSGRISRQQREVPQSITCQAFQIDRKLLLGSRGLTTNQGQLVFFMPTHSSRIHLSFLLKNGSGVQ